MGEPVQVHVVTETRNLRASPFVPPVEQVKTGRAWEEWLEGIEREFRFFKIIKPEDQKDAMLIFGGQEITRLSKTLPEEPVPEGENADDEYKKLRRKMNAYYLPKRNKHHSRYIFNNIRTLFGETTNAYAVRLREQANDCEFDNVDDRILEHLMLTTSNKSLVRKAMGKDWILTKFLQEAAQLEDTEEQIKDMTSKQSIAKVYNKQTYGKNIQPDRPDVVKEPCSYCGLKIHKPGENCPAFGKTCLKCDRKNHFARQCKATPTTDQKGDYKKGRIKKAEAEQTNSDDTSSDGEFFDEVAAHLKTVKLKRIRNKDNTVTVRIGDVNVRAEMDSGADKNVMDEHQFKALQNRSNNTYTLEPSKIKLSNLMTELPVKGEFSAVIRNQTCGVSTRIVVVKGHMESPPLISRDTLIDLGMMQLHPDGALAQKNSLRIKEIRNHPRSTTQEMVNKKKQVLKGIGEIRDNKADKENKERFEHHKVTPEHARANGEAESFMKLMNKTEQIAKLQGRDCKIAVQEMLTGYRSTPHPATKVTPYEALMNRSVRTKLDHCSRNPDKDQDIKDREMDDNGKNYKQKIAAEQLNRNTKQHKFHVGDFVLLKQAKRNKWSTAYEPSFYVIQRIDGSFIKARRLADGKEVYRDSSKYKKVNGVVDKNQEVTQQDHKEDSDEEIDEPAQPARNQPAQQQPAQRPQRNRRLPARLNDYHLDWNP